MLRRILYLQTTSEIGGADIALLGLIKGLDPTRYQAIAGLPHDGPLVGQLREAGCQVLFMPYLMKLSSRGGVWYRIRFVLNFPWACLRLAFWIRANHIHLVHTNTLHNLYGLFGAVMARVPHIWHVREIVIQSRFFLRLEQHLARYSTRVIATSEASKCAFLEGAPAEIPIVKISDSVDLERFHPGVSGRRILEENALPALAPVVGLLCRQDHWKGIRVFIEAAALVAPKKPDARFLIAGGSVEGREAYAEEMVRLAAALGLENCMRFTGWKYGPSDMPEVHASLRLLVLPSTWPEPFGLVLVESMASGNPVIATAHGGPAEIVEPGVTGILVAPGNVKALAEAMMTLLSDPEMARRMGQAGRRRAELLFSSKGEAAALQSIYDDILNTPPEKI